MECKYSKKMGEFLHSTFRFELRKSCFLSSSVANHHVYLCNIFPLFFSMTNYHVYPCTRTTCVPVQFYIDRRAVLLFQKQERNTIWVACTATPFLLFSLLYFFLIQALTFHLSLPLSPLFIQIHTHTLLSIKTPTPSLSPLKKKHQDSF